MKIYSQYVILLYKYGITQNILTDSSTKRKMMSHEISGIRIVSNINGETGDTEQWIILQYSWGKYL